MAVSLQAAANNICHRIAMEYVCEGDPRPVVTWTNKHELKDNRLWIEVRVYDDYATTTGWTDGVEEYGFITFLSND